MSQGTYAIEIDEAAERLAATEHARCLVEEALSVLNKSGVRNHKVKDALLAAQSELARFKRSTKFAITKRRERMKKCRPSIN